MSSKHEFLKSKTRIGSSSNAVNYTNEQSAFNYDEIPKNVKQRKSDVLEYKKSKILDFNYKPWNKSNKHDVKLCDRRTMENFVYDRSKNYNYNYRSETLDYLKNPSIEPKTNKFQFTLNKSLIKNGNILSISQQMRVKEMPIHPKLESKPEWNDTTTNHIITQPMSKIFPLPDIKDKFQLTDYVNPIKFTNNISKVINELKKEGKFNPKERLDKPESTTHKRTYYKNRNAIEKSRSFKVHQHTGIYEYNPIEKRHMWSDTGSFDPESIGDKSTIYDPDAYNYEGPRMATPIRQSSSRR